GPVAAPAGAAGDEGPTPGGGAAGAAAAAGPRVRGPAGRVGPGGLAVLGPVRRERLLGADGVRPPADHPRRRARRGAAGGAGPPCGPGPGGPGGGGPCV